MLGSKIQAMMNLESPDYYSEMGRIRPYVKIFGNELEVKEIKEQFVSNGFTTNMRLKKGEYFGKLQPDLIVVMSSQNLDKIRGKHQNAPIIALTDHENDVNYLNNGADIVLRNDVDPQILTLLSRNMLRRAAEGESVRRKALISVKNGIVVDPTIRIAYNPKNVDHFTPTDSRILAGLILRRTGLTFSEIGSMLRHADSIGEEKIDSDVKVTISRLRKKLPDNYIITFENRYLFNPKKLMKPSK